MSRIAGVYYAGGVSVEQADLARMASAMAYRGSGAFTSYCRASLGLAHLGLRPTSETLHATIPLVGGTARRLIVTADARLDNRTELIDALGLTKHPADISDAELILAAYERWERHSPEKLLGDFAFVVWDEARQALFCARDHFGVKPLYYTYQPHRLFAFASEIKALFSLPAITRRLNEAKIAEYLVDAAHYGSSTYYQDVFRLPPGHAMLVAADSLLAWPYWSLDPTRELTLDSDEAYAEGFREVFTSAVRSRLRSAFPVGAMLSGGLDSSSIVCVGRQALADADVGPLHTFSAVFDDVPDSDERYYIRAVVAGGGVAPHYVHPDRVGPLNAWQHMLQHVDEPFFPPNLFVSWLLYEAARQAGVHVLLDGFGGDLTVSYGDAYLTELAYTGRWSALAQEANALSAKFNVPSAYYLRRYGFPYLGELSRNGRWLDFGREATEVAAHFDVSRPSLFVYPGLKPWTPQSVRRAWRTLRGGKRAADCDQSLVHPDFAQRLRLQESLAARKKSAASQGRSTREIHYQQLSDGIIPQALEVLDRATAAFSIDGRYPFFDRRLVEYCLSLPPQQRLHQGWTRVTMRRAMRDILPPEVQERSIKGNLGPNFVRGLLMFDRALVDEVVLHDRGYLDEYVDMAQLRTRYRSYGASVEQQDVTALWKVVTLGLWLRHSERAPEPAR